MADRWDTPEFAAAVEAMVADMKETAGLCSATYFHNQHGWNSGVGTDEVGNDGGFYWLARGLVARGYVIAGEREPEGKDNG